MRTPYIADIIGEEYKEWDSSRPIIIHAPMGSGKTYFVLNVLLPYVHSKGKKLVYLAHWKNKLNTIFQMNTVTPLSPAVTNNLRIFIQYRER